MALGAGTGACSVTMDQAKNVTATFTTTRGEGNIINAASCNNTAALPHIQNAINQAGDGDTVRIPAGDCTVTQTITSNNKSIAIIGAGSTSTILRNGVGTFRGRIATLNTKTTGFESVAPGYFRISGIGFIATPGVNCDINAETQGLIQVGGFSKNFRFDHNRVIITDSSGPGCGGLMSFGPHGVIHNNTFEQTYCCRHLLVLELGSYNGIGNFGDNSWASPSTMGTADTMHIEDNVFTALGSRVTFFTDGEQGHRSAYRFNTLNGAGSLQNHGTESGGRNRGFRHAEYYENTLNNSTDTNGWVIFRGGTGFAIRNTAINSANARTADANTYRNLLSTNQIFYPFGNCRYFQPVNLTCSGTTATITSPAFESGKRNICSGNRRTGDCYIDVTGAAQSQYNVTGALARGIGSSLTYTISSCPGPARPLTGIRVGATVDGNSGSTGDPQDDAYRCMDQAGSGQSVLFSGSTADWIQFTPVGKAKNAREPIYVVGNLRNGTLSGSSAQAPVVVPNRDIYTEIAGFNGTVGVGQGPRSSRPATCTPGPGGGPGVGWLAIGVGTWNTKPGGTNWVLDVCTATNTWTNGYYTPYTYPHPLTLVP
jgi:hypothetical protein